MNLQKRFSNLTSLTKQMIGKNKWKLAVGAVLLTGFVPFQAATANEVNSELRTIYHVYVNSERLGTIDDMKVYERLVERKLEEKSEQFPSFELMIGEEVELIPERVFQVRTNTVETLALMEQQLTVKANAAALYVDDEAILYVHDEEEADELLHKMKLQYVSEESLKDLEVDYDENNLPVPNIGEKILLELNFSAEVEVKDSIVKPENILTVQEGLKKLNLGTLEEKKYIVAQGDVLGTIAEKHQLTTAELLKLNPEVDENTLLQIGREMNVTDYKPVMTVISKEVTATEEKMPFSTKTEEDKTMWKGDRKIIQEGKEGKRVVHYEVVRENGRTIKREITKENIVSEPIERIVKVGTKVATSRGTGSLGWPAVGGYISSYQGTRWGRFHRGIDIARPSNYNILAADNGTVTSAGWRGGYGNTIEVNHNNGVTTLYAHLSSIDVRVGQTVSKGQKIGVMGQTGNSTGIHLHFEVYQNGQLKNPMDYLRK